MAGELSGSEASAGWSPRNVAEIAVVLIGLNLIIAGVDLLVLFLCQLFPALDARSLVSFSKPNLMLVCGNTFLALFVGLWLAAHHRKISARLFPAAPGVPVAERRATLAFAIKVSAVAWAAWAAIGLFNTAANIIENAEVFFSKYDLTLGWSMLSPCLAYLAVIAACICFLRRPGWLVRFAYPEGESDEDA